VKRFKKSKFDPYINEIKSLVDSGCSARQIADAIEGKMDDVVDDSALYVFIVSRGLRTKRTREENAGAIPHCERCENCMTVMNTNDNDVWLCVETKRIANKSCRTSPQWCPKRERQAV
jgi:hypothetical protein